MAKSAYIGIDNIARKVKKMFVGVDGIARKVKKAYIGIDGVARLFFGGAELKYIDYDSTPGLTRGRRDMRSANAGDYLLFAGGEIMDYSIDDARYTELTNVDAYDANLTKHAVNELDSTHVLSRYDMYGYTFDDCAVFCSVVLVDDSYNVVQDKYDSNLTKYFGYSGMLTPRYVAGCASFGDKALIVGGRDLSDGVSNAWISGRVDIINKNGTAQGGYADIGSYGSTANGMENGLSVPREEMGSAIVGNYALFAGGDTTNNTCLSSVEVFSKDIVRTSAANLKIARCGLIGSSVGKYALFAGASMSLSDAERLAVDAYDENLTKVSVDDLSITSDYLATAFSPEFAVFIGQNKGKQADAYDENLTRTTYELNDITSTAYRRGMTGGHIGNYLLIGGGGLSSNGDTTFFKFEIS